MLVVLSPAKTLDFKTPPTTQRFSVPEYLDESGELIDVLRRRTPRQLEKLMSISPKLADENAARYLTWQRPFTPDNAKQAVLAFRGDVYLGLEAERFDQRDLNWAQKHLRILSGLHGVLRPLDLIQPYRLEMGTALETRRGKSLYEFWGGRITAALNEALAEQGQPLLINLASKEYFDAVDLDALEARVITPHFRDWKNGQYRFLSFFAKKARGLIAAYVIRNRVRTQKALRDFDWAGYRFDPEQSSDDDWVFLRDAPA